MKIRKNGDVITLTENDLKKIVKKVLVTEAPVSDPSIKIKSFSQNSYILPKDSNWFADDTDDKLKGIVSVYGDEYSNKDKYSNKGTNLIVYGEGGFSPTSQYFSGCKVESVEKRVPAKSAGASSKQVVWNIKYSLNPECKMKMWNAVSNDPKFVQKFKNGFSLGTLKLDTNGGDVNVPVVFTGTMRNSTGKSDI